MPNRIFKNLKEKERVLARAVFTIKSAEERAFAKVTDSPKLIKGSFVMHYKGDIVGEGVLGELKIFISDNLATIYGLERIMGTLGEKKGTFVLQHTGIFRDGILNSRRTVVPGTGTGDLKGLTGEINFTSGPGEEFPVEFNYTFEN